MNAIIARSVENTEEPLIVDTGDIPEVQRNNIASAVLDGVISFFEDAGNQARFEKWMEARQSKIVSASTASV